MKKNFISLFMLLPATLLLTSLSFATTKNPTNHEPLSKLSASTIPKTADTSGFDIILLIDSSGSMKQTDPHNYRKDAAKLFISLLGDHDRVGIMSFGDAATLLMPPLTISRKNRLKLFHAVDQIASRELTTNITDALQKGFEQLRSSVKKNRILLLMSDGKLALGSPEKDIAALAGLTRIMPELAKAGVKLYTVAFTQESDSAMLENLARDTGGFFRYAKSDQDVHVMFMEIFEKIKSPDAIPFEGENFTIDREIQEAIVLVSKKAGTALALIDPAGKKISAASHADNLQWYTSKLFDMITITKPEIGKWSVKLSTNEGNRVFVITDLGLKSSFNDSFATRGETLLIDAWLEKEGKIITEPALLENAAFTAEALGPDQRTVKFDLLAGGGAGKHASGLAPTIAGEYRVKIMVTGKTFKREKIIQFKAIEPPTPVVPPLVTREVPTSTPPGPLSPPVALHPTEEISWAIVFLKLVLINLVVGLISGSIYIIKIKVSKKTVGTTRGKNDKG